MVSSGMMFVFLFFALFLASQLALKTPKAKNAALLVFSILFYLWCGPGYALLLVGITGITWFFGLLIQAAAPGQKKSRLGAALVILLGLVVFFRYRGFLASVTQSLLDIPETVPQLILPVGIAWYSLMMISYLLDVYRGTIRAETSFRQLLTYTSLFHVALGGPLVRYADLRKPLARRRSGLSALSSGISRFSIGLAKRAILAESLMTLSGSFLVSDPTALSRQPALALWLGLLAYGLAVYLTLSGYADMAIGLGNMCGFSYPEEFDYPFTAYTIGDFWSKWQMTMIGFFKDYLHDPLGDVDGSAAKEIPLMLGLWLLIGLWLGAGWNYVLWALYFFLLLALETYVLWRPLSKLPWNLRRVITLVLVLISFLILRFAGTGNTLTAAKGLLCMGGGLVSSAFLSTLLNNLPILLLGILAATPLGKKLRAFLSAQAASGGPLMVVDAIWEALHPVVLLILAAMAMTGPTTNPFLFFQF